MIRILATKRIRSRKLHSRFRRQDFRHRPFSTRFNVTLQSVKKISEADIVAGIKGGTGGAVGGFVVERTVDSNARYPFKRKDVLNRVGNELDRVKFTSHTLNVVIYSHQCKNDTRYIFQALGGGGMQYSPEFLSFLKRLTKSQLHAALQEFKLRPKRKARS